MVKKLKKAIGIKSVESEVSKLISKEFKKKVKLEAKKQFAKLQRQREFQKAPIRTSARELATQFREGQRRQKVIGILGSRAEQIEVEMLELDEIPLLNQLEKRRAIDGSPPQPRFLARFEKKVTDSFPQ